MNQYSFSDFESCGEEKRTQQKLTLGMVEFIFSNSDYISVKVILQIKVIYIANRGSRIKDQGDRFQTRMLLQWTQHPAGLSTRLADLLEKVKSNMLSIEVKSISQIKHDLDRI